jgi:predicted nucleotide-binding protein (sugar kinase/HSP70/actin superfamily)
MGRLSTELLAASLRSAGISAEAMPLADTPTLQLARNHASGKECLPSHLVLGEALRFFGSEQYRKDEIYLLFVPTTTGPCRTGQYFVFYENLFKDLRLDNVVVITLDSDNSYNELGPDFSKHAWWGLVISDYMKDVETSLRACAEDPVAAMKKYDELWHRLVSVAERDVSRVLPTLEEIADGIARIPLKRTIEECPRVLVVGEIYVRRDDFAVDELIQHFSSRGIIGKVSGITEWVYYCDYTRRHEIRKRYGLLPWYRRPFSRELRELAAWKLEAMYKHRVEHRVSAVLRKTDLLPETPHDMDRIMENAEKYFVSDELHSEISVSTGVAATAMMDGYSGVVNIAPFACLIGRVIEGILTPWARERHYPVMSVEIDGNLLPPTIVNKLDIFMLNVLRFRENPAISSLVEPGGGKRELLSRMINGG